MIDAFLFDLDGTLIDTAPDLGAALNNLLIEENHAPLPLKKIRPYISRGVTALTQLGFSDKHNPPATDQLRQRYLDHYRVVIADSSRLFDGFEGVLAELESRALPWGIVTNKPQWLTDALIEALGLAQRAAVVIGGDTLAERKPHPLPLQVAAERIGVECARTIYIGDDERDIIAGRSAGMKTLIAAYGYIEDMTQIENWRADGVIQSPGEILAHPLVNLK